MNTIKTKQGHKPETADMARLPKGIYECKNRNGYRVQICKNGIRLSAMAETLAAAKTTKKKLLLQAIVMTKTGNKEKEKHGSDMWTLSYAVKKTFDTTWQGQPCEAMRISLTKSLIEYFGKDMPLDHIDLQEIDGFVKACRLSGNCGSTINRKLTTLSRVLRTAYDRKIIDGMPRLPYQKESQNRIRFLTMEEEKRMLDFIDDQNLRDIVLALIYTGMRCGELFNLQTPDVDMPRGILTIWKSKNGTVRSLPIVDKIKPVIERHFIDAQKKQCPQYLFSKPAKFNYLWDTKIRKPMGMQDDPQFVPHMLRHTCATRLAKSGVSMPVIKEWMGHNSINTTIKYAHFSPDDLRNAAVKLMHMQ